MNDLSSYRDIFADLEPWSGSAPEGYIVDCMGILTPLSFILDPDLIADKVGSNGTLLAGSGRRSER